MNKGAVLAGTAAFAPWLAWWGVYAATAAAAAGTKKSVTPGPPLTFDVVVPAHDEEANVARLLDSLGPEASRRARLGRVIVVADHCHDRTAEVARQAGAHVLERTSGQPGKPPALRAGVAWLASQPGRGDAVVLIDADCVCEPGFLDGLAARFAAGATAVQAAYLISEPEQDAVRAGLRRGFALRNVVRARGADRLGLPIALFGSGIALRWEAVGHATFGDPRIKETGDTRPVADDVLMALELLDAGVHVGFAGEARLWADAPDEDRAIGAQRLRWEAGQVLMWRRAVRSAGMAARRGDWRAVVGLVEWMAPPLSASVGAFGVATAAAAGGVAVGVLDPGWLAPPAVAAALLCGYLVTGIWVLEGPAAVVDTARGAGRFLTWKARLYGNHRSARRAA